MSGKIAKIILTNKKWLKKILPVGLRQKWKQCYLNRVMDKYQGTPIDKQEFEKLLPGVNLIGDIRAEIGLGQSMRLVANELEVSGCPYGIYNFQLNGNVRRGDHSFDDRISNDYPYRINLFHINPQETAYAYVYFDKAIWKNHYNIAFWLWELQEFPKEYLGAIRFFDEIWTPSEFTSDCIRRVTDKPVYTMPYYVVAEREAGCGRRFFGLPEDKFLYLVMYDTNSTMERKNPLGALEAYKRAFPEEKPDIGLVIKMNNPAERDLAVIRAQLEGYRNVYFVTEILEKPQVNSLIACVDVFLSLHRAEGFGLVMAEAMLNGTVCVATNWSSNTEFMNPDVACMVDYKMTELDKDSGPYKKGSRWADPDIAQAAEYVLKLYKDTDYYRRLVKNAKEYIGVRLGRERVSTLLRKRADELLTPWK